MKNYLSNYLCLLAFVFIVSSCTKNETIVTPITIAHRGLYSDRPENSKQSFQECLKKGITSVEFDVYMTKDDSIILVHDLNVEDVAGLPGQVNEYTTQELKNAIFAKTGAKTLTFNEFLNRYKNRFNKIFIDLKEGQGTDIIYKTSIQIAKLAQTEGGTCKTFVTCTSAYPLDTIMQINPSINTVLEINNVQDYLQSSQRFSYILIGYTNLVPEESKMIRDMGTRIITFTPNTVTEYKTALENGCYAIMTDDPSLLNDYLAQTLPNEN